MPDKLASHPFRIKKNTEIQKYYLKFPKHCHVLWASNGLRVLFFIAETYNIPVLATNVATINRAFFYTSKKSLAFLIIFVMGPF